MKAIVTMTLAALLLSAGIAQATDRKNPQDPGAPAQPAAATTSAARTQKLDINRATVDELVGVPGLGQRMAQAIVNLRTRKGSFSRMEELLEVPGIKEKKLAVLVGHLAVTPAPSPGAASAVK